MYTLVQKIFSPRKSSYNSFCAGLINENIGEMKRYINDYLQTAVTSFDSLNNVSSECFYHGMVLGFISELRPHFLITSNQENEEGSYYVIIKSLNTEIYPNSYILEFAIKSEEDNDLLETAENALMLITLNGYDKKLKSEGIPSKNIKEYGFAFDDKDCEILLQTAKSPRHPELAIPDFEIVEDYAFHEKEKVYIIDKNEFDIWEGVIDLIKNTEYSIHYPDYPTDDEDVERKRIIPCTHKNRNIFKHQEKQRRKYLELKEQNREMDVKNEGVKRKKKHKKS